MNKYQILFMSFIFIALNMNCNSGQRSDSKLFRGQPLNWKISDETLKKRLYSLACSTSNEAAAVDTAQHYSYLNETKKEYWIIFLRKSAMDSLRNGHRLIDRKAEFLMSFDKKTLNYKGIIWYH